MDLQEKLKRADCEKDIENTYRELFSKHGSISSPHKTDGLLTLLEDGFNPVNVLLEFKYKNDFTKIEDYCAAIAQCIAYLKMITDIDGFLPQCVFLGNERQFTYLPSMEIFKYLSDKTIKWNCPPSNFVKDNYELYTKLIKQFSEKRSFIDSISNFNISDIIIDVFKISNNQSTKVKITPNRIGSLFTIFEKNILKNSKLNHHDRIMLFIQSVVNKNNNYKHPMKKGVLVTISFGEISINESNYNSFYEKFGGFDYSGNEINTLIQQIDKIVNDIVKRREGEFYTPEEVVLIAEEYIANEISSNWFSEFTVWDNCCGAGNLTRERKYSKLYQSTLHQSDLDTMNQIGVNPGAVKFQFDFLNDDFISRKDGGKVPDELYEDVICNRKILFFVNPPYAAPTNVKTLSTSEAEGKNGIADTKVFAMMNDFKMGKAADNLYAQFLFRMWYFSQAFNNENIYIAIFSKELFLSGSTFVKFRNLFLNSFEYRKSFLCQANLFSGNTDLWGVLFSIWKPGITKEKYKFEVDIYKTDFDGICLYRDKAKTLYNLDDKEKTTREWVTTKGELINYPNMNGPYSIKNDKTFKMNKDSLANMCLLSNNVYENEKGVYIVSGVPTRGTASISVSITKDNLYKICSLFSARKLITGKYANWINDKDEYMIPNIEHEKWNEFAIDSLIFSLCSPSSYQSSLRDISYLGKRWNITNRMFFMNMSEIMNKIRDLNFIECINDISTNGHECIIADIIQNHIQNGEISFEAKEVFLKMKEITLLSFENRKTLQYTDDEKYYYCWDAGWYQVKQSMSGSSKIQLFNDLLKKLEAKMRPCVYELRYLLN